MANTIFPRPVARGPGGRTRHRPRRMRHLDDEPERARQRATLPASVAPGGSPAASGGYTGPAASIEYSIWGDPAEIDSQTKLVESFEAVNPTIDVKVSVADWDSYWEKLLTGLAGGAAPDVFAMDGPLFPDYQARDVLLDLQPLIERDGYDLSQLADQGVGVFKTADGAQFGLPRDLNVVVLYYNKKMFDAAGIPYPDDTWDWAKLIEVGKQLTLDTNSDGTTDQWGLYTETSDMENYWLSLVWQNGGDFFAADGKSTALDDRPGRPAASSSCRTSSTRTRSWPSPRSSPTSGTPSSRAWPPWRSTAPGSSRPTRPPASSSASRRSRPDRRVGSRPSTRPVRSSTRGPRPRTPPGSSSSTWPAHRPRSSSCS